MKKFIIVAIIMFSANYAVAENPAVAGNPIVEKTMVEKCTDECKKSDEYKGANNPWSNFWSYSKTYIFLYDTQKIASVNTECTNGTLNNKTAEADGENTFFAGKDSVFYINHRANNDSYDIIEFEDIKLNGNDENKSVEKNKAFKLCKNNDIVPSYAYKRTGGIDTGLLVVPFKYRTGGELSGDASVGPYVGVAGEKFSVLASIGLSQIAITDVNTKEVENRTGVTAAAGINWSIATNFDIAFIVGVDHLSGSAGDDFKFQDKVWGSFGIGYNFTK